MIKNFPGRLLSAFYSFKLISDILINAFKSIDYCKEQINSKDFIMLRGSNSFNYEVLNYIDDSLQIPTIVLITFMLYYFTDADFERKK